MRRFLLWLTVLLLVTSHPISAQQQPADTLARSKPHPDPEATPVLVPSDTVAQSVSKGKSPALAMLLSAALPGAGQAYNASYWKVPIVVGLGIYFVSEWLNYNRLTGDYRDKYNESLLTYSGGDSRLYTLREFYKTQRDSFAWYFVIMYFLNIADAYVDASLSAFDVGENLALRFGPNGGRWELRLQF
jgi:hypothetical protein